MPSSPTKSPQEEDCNNKRKDDVYNAFTSTDSSVLSSPFFHIRPTLHNGFGCFASVDIPRHTIILIEQHPLICGPQLELALNHHESGKHSCQEDDDTYLRDVCQLSFQQRQLVWQMHDQYNSNNTNNSINSNSNNKHQQNGLNEHKRLWGIFYSNAFFNDELGCNSLYYWAAKFNHSCRPTVGYDFDGPSMRLWTTRFVHEGEELHDCYSDVVYHQPAYRRQLYLHSKYQFYCQCVACCRWGYGSVTEKDDNNDQDDKDDLIQEQSDVRRWRIQQIAKNLHDELGIDFLYSPTLEEEVEQIVMASENNQEEESHHSHGSINDSEDTLSTTFPSLAKKHSYHRDNNGSSSSSFSSSIPFKHHQHNPNRKQQPKTRHLDLVLEYLELLQQEGIDHDTLDVWMLAYDLAVFLRATNILQHYRLADTCWQVQLVHKGQRHPTTLSLQEKLRNQYTTTY
ncbi:SET methyltransferase domain containing protein [Nitzschia inconspicua]|uniref:SET methyltransferase domain containing protein n=1 Tax=Nitzschia inconspicua TaxID=303405 RepID=A0A9K3KIV1_9STRA|nr:SET methyltransferase domain containing protein [Nitzschia inconspicua]